MFREWRRVEMHLRLLKLVWISFVSHLRFAAFSMLAFQDDLHTAGKPPLAA